MPRDAGAYGSPVSPKPDERALSEGGRLPVAGSLAASPGPPLPRQSIRSRRRRHQALAPPRVSQRRGRTSPPAVISTTSGPIRSRDVAADDRHAVTPRQARASIHEIFDVRNQPRAGQHQRNDRPPRRRGHGCQVAEIHGQRLVTDVRRASRTPGSTCTPSTTASVVTTSRSLRVDSITAASSPGPTTTLAGGLGSRSRILARSARSPSSETVNAALSVVEWSHCRVDVPLCRVGRTAEPA